MKEYGLFVKRWYEYLEEGKIMAVRCRECGSYEFPPVYCCGKCSGTDMEWVEISGEAQALDIAYLPIANTSIDFTPIVTDSKENEDLQNASCPAYVKLKEGPELNNRVFGIGLSNKETLFHKLPIPIKAEIVQKDGFKTVNFRYTGEEG